MSRDKAAAGSNNVTSHQQSEVVISFRTLIFYITLHDILNNDHAKLKTNLKSCTHILRTINSNKSTSQMTGN